MTPGLRLLLTHRFDYAGLFPPARLELQPALIEYLEHQRSADAWMLGQFVCPARLLAEVPPEQPPPVTVVGTSGKDEAEFRQNLLIDAKQIESYQERSGGLVGGYEVRLPGALSDRVFKLIRETLGPGLGIFCEAPPTPELVERVLLPLRDSGCQLGYKLRCGGLDPAGFPSIEQVASVLLACRDLDVSLKLTAGLHHPLRNFDRGLQTPMHGFVNILMASLLARARGLGFGEITEVLTSNQAGDFHWSEVGCGWREHRVSLGEVREIGSGISAIGSCSFTEPRDDLRALGWW